MILIGEVFMKNENLSKVIEYLSKEKPNNIAVKYGSESHTYLQMLSTVK